MKFLPLDLIQCPVSVLFWTDLARIPPKKTATIVNKKSKTNEQKVRSCWNPPFNPHGGVTQCDSVAAQLGKHLLSSCCSQRNVLPGNVNASLPSAPHPVPWSAAHSHCQANCPSVSLPFLKPRCFVQINAPVIDISPRF